MGSPILKKEMTITLQEKQQLLQQWVNNGENCEKIETSLRLTRCQEGELEKGRELLTISEMKSRGFSTSLGTSRTVLTHTPKILDQKYSMIQTSIQRIPLRIPTRFFFKWPVLFARWLGSQAENRELGQERRNSWRRRSGRPRINQILVSYRVQVYWQRKNVFNPGVGGQCSNNFDVHGSPFVYSHPDPTSFDQWREFYHQWAKFGIPCECDEWNYHYQR